MGLFNQRKPRSFHHEYMFVDRRKDRLEAMKECAKRELSMPENNVPGVRMERGVFLKATKYAVRGSERRSYSGRYLTTVFAVILIFLLVLIWKLLLCL